MFLLCITSSGVDEKLRNGLHFTIGVLNVHVTLARRFSDDNSPHVTPGELTLADSIPHAKLLNKCLDECKHCKLSLSFPFFLRPSLSLTLPFSLSFSLLLSLSIYLFFFSFFLSLSPFFSFFLPLYLFFSFLLSLSFSLSFSHSLPSPNLSDYLVSFPLSLSLSLFISFSSSPSPPFSLSSSLSISI